MSVNPNQPAPSVNPTNNPTNPASSTTWEGYAGQRWLVEERDACGVGVIADQYGRASHGLIAKALSGLGCLEHRGACSADQDSGDGAGIMSAIPWKLLETEWFQPQALSMPSREQLGVAMVFLPQNAEIAQAAKSLVEQVCKEVNLTILGWRDVPVRPELLGIQARENQPDIEQFLVKSDTLKGDELERLLYLTRKRIEKAVLTNPELADLYLCSFSTRQITYKGMVRSVVLGEFYQDLKNPLFESPYAIFHRRFSTNTMPRWPLAQPLRLLGHNGEINTLLGNVNWVMAREATLKSELWGESLADLKPLVNRENSDSASLDNVLELLVLSGRDPEEALMILVPEAYNNQPDLADHPEIVDFYNYYSGIQEPWDGPALLVFSDGKKVGAALDRNGLRPARYCITADGCVVVSSEAGAVDIPNAEIIEKGRLGPGQAIAIDLDRQEVIKNWEIKSRVAAKHPYGEWLKQYRETLAPQEFLSAALLDTPTLICQQMAFGYTAEDVEMVVEEMAATGKEPTFCMGDDIPLAVLSQKPHVLYDYFKQRFAQVTNPPIDPLRESLVMSLQMALGDRGDLLVAKPENAKQIILESPVLNEPQLDTLKARPHSVSLSTLYATADGPQGLKAAVEALCEQAYQAVAQGAQIVILSDRTAGTLSADSTYIPPLLAVGAVHYALSRQGVRCQASLVVDTAQAWSVHHFACLIGYGASAVCPYLALETVRHWVNDPKTQSLMSRGKLKALTLEAAQKNYQKATEAGLLKILSKMGISLLSSYHGAQIFEAIGIGQDLLELGFAGTASRLGGLSVADLAHEVMAFHKLAFPELTLTKLQNFGFVNYRPGLEYHMNSPEMAKALHKAVQGQEYNHYELYKKYLENRPVTALRDLLDFNADRAPISIDEVEPVEEIMKRFCTGGMSLGALSREAHETLAIAMNRIGGKSNSGEGGEDPLRYQTIEDADAEGRSPTFPHLKGLKNGDTASSAIKQVASGRFGVTPEYLTSARQIEIKMAQGAKPGEGGQLPGKKVSPYIAMLRRSKPGVDLISPPPHHDIYSIEDLAQLIYDLHAINPTAKVSVKLVAEVGIGTIAAGVAKANADIIQISGHDGGTGASPLSSIKHAGSPWELGVTEVHRVLLENGLRGRVLLRADGGFKTGWDVLMGALMGAEEFGFGSIAMIAEGCIMARICHTNNCPVGVATQQEKLRDRFVGTPENVVNFFYFIAQEVRMILAELGYRRLSDVIGRADLLKARAGVKLTKTEALSVGCLLNLPDVKTDRSFLEHEAVHSNGEMLDDQLLQTPGITDAIANQTAITHSVKTINTDRAVGTRLAGAIAARYGGTGFAGSITLKFQGSAGQSFGAFNLPGMTLILEGEANDYVGKGMHGGEIIINPPSDSQFIAADNVIIGNTCLYGATGGVLFAQGKAGERFAVRNSLAKAVIEGAGDHCCEYMTGGVVVVLGKVGRNVGAGMTGGLGYFLDEEGNFSDRVNKGTVKLQRVNAPAGIEQLKSLIEAHWSRTGSVKAKVILDQWQEYLPKFWQLVPPSEADSPEASAEVNSEKVAVSA